MIYVVQNPHTSTNPTARYRVIDSEAWLTYVNGDALSYPVASVHDTYEQAETARDQLNGVDPCAHEWTAGMMVVHSEDLDTIAHMRAESGSDPIECGKCEAVYQPA